MYNTCGTSCLSSPLTLEHGPTHTAAPLIVSLHWHTPHKDTTHGGSAGMVQMEEHALTSDGMIPQQDGTTRTSDTRKCKYSIVKYTHTRKRSYK